MRRIHHAAVCGLLLVGHGIAQRAVAFDAVRQRVISFGTVVRVWEAPTVWRTLSTSGMGGPPQSVFDPVQNRVIAIYSYATGPELRIWDGSAWTSWGQVPGQLGSNLLAWDTLRNRLVALVPAWPNMNQTWEWSSAGAVGPLAVLAPPVGSFTASWLAFDPATQQVMAHGPSSAAGTQTWLWNGTVWTLAASGNGPPYSLRSAVAGDPVRRRLVCQANTDTWEWDGARWTLVATNGPSSNSIGMVYEPTLAMCLLVGFEGYAGLDGWTGNAWVPVAPRSRPRNAYVGGSSAYDIGRDRLVAFGGGLVSSGVRLVSDETWTWAGTDWLQAAPPTRPGGRERNAMEYHAASQRVVLFGGRDAAGALLGDTWLWDGANWSASAGPGPSPRQATALAYEGSRGTCLLFGGEGSGTPAELSDTWEWNGAAWLARQPLQSPPARVAPALAHDPTRGRTVLTAGTAAGTTLFNDTWEWDGTTWQSLTPNPPAPRATALAYHARRNRILATGYMGQVSEWDGVSWTTANLPWNARAFKDYDVRRGTLVTPGGLYESYLESPLIADPVTGPGCGGAAGSPGLTTSGWPVLGDPWFAFEMTSPLPQTPVVLGLSPASGTLPLGSGCDWQLTSLVAWHYRATDARGFARWPWNIRIDPNLVGRDFHAQGLALDPTAPLGFGLTNHLHFTIGL